MSNIPDLCSEHKDCIVSYIWQDECPLCKALEELSRTQDELSDSRKEVTNLLGDISSLRDEIKGLNEDLSKA